MIIVLAVTGASYYFRSACNLDCAHWVRCFGISRLVAEQKDICLLGVIFAREASFFLSWIDGNESAATESKSPTHVAYHVREGNEKSLWTRIGAAWQHNDKNGFNIQVDFVSLDGRITLRSVTEKKD